ncbi:hypothetical protein AB835_14430 [Candidatus Endobugula sertula]|uniref:Recombinase XerD n=1 Tax=Candidatus Endobugula sertula TaxID=62101 RepID=A0A1D2QLE6_9GAMM|nr:hypothetical protein AB835_14430 [Candidatus Endobugula sertula]
MALRRKKHNSRTRFKRVVEHNGFYPYFSRYLSVCESQGVSKDTIKRRDSALRRFIEWCDDQGLDDPKSITKPMLERYQRYLYHYRKDNGEPLSMGSQHVMLTPVKSFFKWLTQENYLLYNPASELVLPKKPKGLPRNILTVEEVIKILNQPDTTTLEGVRDRAILEVFYATGIRRSELIHLKIYEVDHHRQTVFVKEGKYNKDRYLPLGERALQWIQKYQWEVRDHLLTDHQEPHLFLTDYGEPFNGSYIGHHVKKYIEQAGIKVPGSCHLFRHAMATHMLENGADIRFIQAMLGHADLSTTEIYTRVSIEKLCEIYNATHPAKLEQDSLG